MGDERFTEIEHPEAAFERIRQGYRDRGYDERWIEERMRADLIRNDLTEKNPPPLGLSPCRSAGSSLASARTPPRGTDDSAHLVTVASFTRTTQPTGVIRAAGEVQSQGVRHRRAR